MPHQIINQIQRVLSDTARVGNNMEIFKTEEKVERNRESRLSEKIVASCLVALLVEDILGRIYQLDRVPPALYPWSAALRRGSQ